MGKVTHRYVPAETKRDLPEGSKNLAMDALLMSDRLQDVADHAAFDIVDDARKEALDKGLVKTGNYVASFGVRAGAPRIFKGRPRRVAIAYNDSPHAVDLELGNNGRFGHHILFRSGLKYHSPKGMIA